MSACSCAADCQDEVVFGRDFGMLENSFVVTSECLGNVRTGAWIQHIEIMPGVSFTQVLLQLSSVFRVHDLEKRGVINHEVDLIAKDVCYRVLAHFHQIFVLSGIKTGSVCGD